MPNIAKRPCSHPGCRLFALPGGRCEDHKRQIQKQTDQTRGSSTARGYGYKWQQVSKAFLRAHPLCQCENCLEGLKQLKQAHVVDHIKPHKGDMALFWDRNNWQAMAKECHDKKTAREDGGFGRTAGQGGIKTL